MWARLSVTLAGTLGWLLLAFLAGVAAIYIPTALQATWGGPPLWPVFAGAAGVIVVTIIGFTCGVFFPGRFTAPLVAIGVLVLSPGRVPRGTGRHGLAGLVGHVRAAVAAPAPRPLSTRASTSTSRRTCRSCRSCSWAGSRSRCSACSPCAAALRRRHAAACRWRRRAGTTAARGRGRPGRGGRRRVVDRLLARRDREADRHRLADPGAARRGPRSAGPVRPRLHRARGFQVCVHPAFSGYLGDVAAALDPVAAEIAGLPGAPVRAEQVASAGTWPSGYGPSHTAGNPPVLEYSGEQVGDLFGVFWGIPAGRLAGLARRIPAGSPRPVPHRTAAFGGRGANRARAARRGAAGGGGRALMIAAGSQPPLRIGQHGHSGGPSQAQITAAASRFASLPASARHAWLAAHLAALRAGTITAAQIP